MSNENKVVACQEKRIPSKISQLRSQNNELNGPVTKDIQGFVDRIRNIGLRLNHVDHPDNVPKDEVSLSKKYDGLTSDPSRQVDGLEGDLNDVIEQSGMFINAWHNDLYRQLDKYLYYIEEHI